MISGAFYFGVQTRLAQTGGPRAKIKNSIYHAHEFYKMIKSVTKIYILSAQDQRASARSSRAGTVRVSSSKNKNPKPEIVSGLGFLYVLLVLS